MADSEERAAFVLIERFETVASAKSFVLRQQRAPRSEDVSNALVMPYAAFFESLTAIGALGEVLELSSSVAVGAGEFHAPAGPTPHIGAARFVFCYVAVLKGSQTLALERYPSAARPPVGIGVAPMWTWELPMQEGEQEAARVFALVSGRLVIISNRPEVAREVALDLTRAPKLNWRAKAFTRAIAESSLWATRRAPKDTGPDSGQSKARPSTMGASIWFAFSPQRRSSKVHISGTAAVERVVNEAMEKEGFGPARRVGPGELEIVATLSDDEASFRRVLMYMEWLGFALYL